MHRHEASQEIRWLHLSDLHFGCRGQSERHQLNSEFEKSIKQHLSQVGPPHLVFVTGDIANTGGVASDAEYEEATEFFNELLNWLSSEEGRKPLLVPAPGNHDVTRPDMKKDMDAAYKYLVLKQMDDKNNQFVQNLKKTLWESKNKNASFIKPLFAAYESWFDKHVFPPLREDNQTAGLHRSFFPGDYSFRYEQNGFRLGVVVLNSSWVQFDDDDYNKKLNLPPPQFHAALPDKKKPLRFFDSCDDSLLLMHHPPEWLSPESLKEFNSHIYLPERFAACLHGHLHKGFVSVRSVFGSKERCPIQALSLFGLENYGTSNVKRMFGYYWGKISKNRELRIWPLVRVERGSDRYEFDVDTRFENRESDGSVLLLRPPGTGLTHDPQPFIKQPADPLQSEIEDYIGWAKDHYSELEMVGIGAGNLRLSFEEVYVPLEISVREVDMGKEDGMPYRRSQALKKTIDDLRVKDIFSEIDEKYEPAIFGEPGAGKTTSLKKLQHLILTQGPESAGLPKGTVPVFLRLRRIDRELLQEQNEQAPARFIQQELDMNAPNCFKKDFGERLWKRGNLLLLLDGLDELVDEDARSAACRFIENCILSNKRRGIRCVVSCRLTGYGGKVRLSGRFLCLDVRPLNDELQKLLIKSWFKAARRQSVVLKSKYPEADIRSESQAEELIKSLKSEQYSVRQIGTLVANPLLLTLLCSVNLQRGNIPVRRTEYYRECMLVLLQRWPQEKENAPVLDINDALEVLRNLAFILHDSERKEDVTQVEFRNIVQPLLQHMKHRIQQLPQPEDLLNWFHKQAGILSRYAENQYGFMHLGIQEYLTAVHAAKAGERQVKALAHKLGDDWWKEPILLMLGLPEHNVFKPFMIEVVKSDALTAQHDLLQQCLNETHALDADVFIEVLQNEKESTEKKEAILRLFMNRNIRAVDSAAQNLVHHSEKRLAELARRFCPVEEMPAARRRGLTEKGQDFTDKICGIRFLHVRAGRFKMGDDNGNEWEKPEHQVRLSPYWLAETPVTNQQYEVFLKATGYQEPTYWRDRKYSDPRQPVVGVNWFDACEFCKWLKEKIKLDVTLPTEAQWEFAARGIDSYTYPWGNNLPDETRASYSKNSGNKPAPVGSFPAGKGPFGHLDLAGNVWEWCLDRWSENAYEKRKEEVADPITSDGDKDWRALRGGGWSDASYLRSSYRNRDHAGDRRRSIGFRVGAAPASL